MLKARNLTIAGLILAALGVATPILWDMWSKPYNLALVVTGRTLLIQNSEKIDNLKVTIGGREIDKLFSTESWPRLFGQIFHGDKWSPAGVALSTVTVAEGPFRP